MADVLGFTLPQPDLHQAFSALNADLMARGNAEEEPERGTTARALHVANGMWGEQTYPFDLDYTALLTEYYGAGLQETDFINAAEPARQEINAWVAEQTEDRIQEILLPGVINSYTRLVLANAIYFYGGWQSTFESWLTDDAEFFLIDGTSVTVPLMSQEAYLPYTRGDGYQVVEFPYDGSDFALTVILPDEGEFETVEAGMDPQGFAAALGELASTDMRVYLPRFEFTFGTVSLVETLKSLGMTEAFTGSASFSGMMDSTAPYGLNISEVLHKAFISVDEAGTEAAAATIVIASVGAAMPPADLLEVRIDRPFLFAIRDTQTGTLLFLGRVMDPST
jgi:serpin B